MTLHCSSGIYFQCGFQIQYGKMHKATYLLSSFFFLPYETMHTPCCDTKLEIEFLFMLSNIFFELLVVFIAAVLQCE